MVFSFISIYDRERKKNKFVKTIPIRAGTFMQIQTTMLSLRIILYRSTIITASFFSEHFIIKNIMPYEMSQLIGRLYILYFFFFLYLNSKATAAACTCSAFPRRPVDVSARVIETANNKTTFY